MIDMETAVANAFGIHHSTILGMCESEVGKAMLKEAQIIRKHPFFAPRDITNNKAPITIHGVTHESIKEAARFYARAESYIRKHRKNGTLDLVCHSG